MLQIIQCIYKFQVNLKCIIKKLNTFIFKDLVEIVKRILIFTFAIKYTTLWGKGRIDLLYVYYKTINLSI